MSLRNERRGLGLLAVSLLVAFAGCAPEDPTVPNYDAPAVAQTRVVALGNSLTAGFTNGGLVAEGQLASFANLVTLEITGANMTLPLIASPGIGSTGAGPLYVTAEGSLESRPIPGGNPLALLTEASRLPAPYDNLGVPGATTRDVTSATSSANSQSAGNLYFDLVLRNSAFQGDNTQLSQMQTLVENAVPKTRTLILWIGNNDLLGGTLSGDPVVGANITPSAGYQALIAPIVSTVNVLEIPQVVLVNIPPVTSIPYVTTIAGLLQQGGLPLTAIRTEESDVQAILLSSQEVFLNADLTPKPEYIIGSGTPTESTLGSEYTLTSAEIAAVAAETAAYNSHLETLATTNGWALVDVATTLSTLSIDPLARPNALFPLLPNPGGAGVVQNVNAAFSLDGIHLSEIGNAVVANAILQALNATYTESFDSYDLADFSNEIGWEDFGTMAGSFVESGFYREIARSPLFQGSLQR